MKKQFILPALIFSLSFSRATFAVDTSLEAYKEELSTMKAKELENHLINEVFPIYSDKDLVNQKNKIDLAQQKRKSIKKTRKIADSIFVGFGIGSIAAATYYCLIGQPEATLFEKKNTLAIISGFGVASRVISNALLQRYRPYKNDYKQKRYNLLKEKSKTLSSNLLNLVLSNHNSEEAKTSAQEHILNNIYSNQATNNITKEYIKNYCACEEFKLRSKPIELDKIVADFLQPSQNETDDNPLNYSRPVHTYENTISLRLIGLAGFIACAPNIFSCIWPYFNNINMSKFNYHRKT